MIGFDRELQRALVRARQRKRLECTRAAGQVGGGNLSNWVLTEEEERRETEYWRDQSRPLEELRSERRTMITGGFGLMADLELESEMAQSGERRGSVLDDEDEDLVLSGTCSGWEPEAGQPGFFGHH